MPATQDHEYENQTHPLASVAPATTCSASSELLENLQEWGEHFRNNQHGATLSILRARKTILDQVARIDALEEVLNRLFHYTDCTTGQMAIIEEILPQNATAQTPPDSGTKNHG